MEICLLTYDAPHLKTAQIHAGLELKSEHRVDFLVMPFVERKPRETLISHRPYQFAGCSARDIAARTGAGVYEYKDWRSVIHRYDWLLVGGSNLIDPELAACDKIINCHAGLIPAVRGLDSFKWALLEGKPLGNTLHIIDEDTDAGRIIAQMETPVYSGDTIETLAQRHYESEICMLRNFDYLLEHGKSGTYEPANPTARMPFAKEREILQEFDSYKMKMAVRTGRGPLRDKE